MLAASQRFRPARVVLGLLLLSFAAPVPHALTQDVASGFLPGNISVIAGGGTGDINIPAVQAELSVPEAIAVDSNGNVFISEGNPSQNPGSPGTNSVLVVASGKGPVPPMLAAILNGQEPQAGFLYGPVTGNNTNAGTLANGAAAALAIYGYIQGMAFDSNDNLYIADGINGVVRLIYQGGPTPPVLTAEGYSPTIGAVYTIAGTMQVASSGAAIGDGGSALQATLSYPDDAKVDSYGNVYITDYSDNVVRVVYAGGTIPLILTAENVTPHSGYIADTYTLLPAP